MAYICVIIFKTPATEYLMILFISNKIHSLILIPAVSEDYKK